LLIGVPVVAVTYFTALILWERRKDTRDHSRNEDF